MSTAVESQSIEKASDTTARDQVPELSVSRVVSTLQLVLASRRAARNADRAYRFSLTRGM
jgi:hypothetical protein